MGIEEQIDRLIDLGEDIKSRLDLLSELASDHFADANKMVVDEPPKKWRIREPGEEVQEGDLMNCKSNPPSDPPDGDGWIDASICVGSEVAASDECVFACPVADEPAKEAESSWEPKVGDWVRVTRPDDWIEWEHPCWAPQMHQFDGKVGKIESEREGRFHICGFAWHGLRFVFHRDWLSPAEPPAKEPAEPEYRQPVLPADAGKVCEFSDDSISWEEGVLIGWRANFNTFNWKSERDSHRYARIKKDA